MGVDVKASSGNEEVAANQFYVEVTGGLDLYGRRNPICSMNEALFLQIPS